MSMLYIGPGMGITSIVLIFLIAGIVLVAFGYIIWLKIKPTKFGVISTFIVNEIKAYIKNIFKKKK